MTEADDLLANLLSVATEELGILNEKTNSLKDADIFKRETNLQAKQIHKTDIHSLIHKGDTDSSDDEENRTHEKKYNDCGRDIKHLLQNTSNSFPLNEHRTSSSWKTNVSFEPNSKPASASKVTKCLDVFVDPIFGLRVINPLISSTVLKDRMVGREAVTFAGISRYIQIRDKEKDWVIAGVVASKSAVKTSQKGNQFCIFTLTDLKGDIKTISLFLFSKAYSELWKTVVGTVIGVLNPNVLDKKDGSKDEACLSVDNPQKVLIFGISKDFGTCKSTKKNGEQCNAIVNRNQCEYCIYHIKQEYQKCSKRSELQANFAGKGLMALRNKVLGKNEVFYAGKSYMAIPAKKNKKLELKDSNRLQSLSQKGLTTISGTTGKISNPKTPLKKGNAARLDVSHAQRLRDLELLKRLGGCSGLETKNSFTGTHSTTISLEESKNIAINVIDKLKLKNSIINKHNENETNVSTEIQMFEKNCSSGALLNHSGNTESNRNINGSVKMSATDCSRSNSFEKAAENMFPVLTANGLNGTIDLNKPISSRQMDRAKLNAIKLIQKNGGIKKVNPNSVRSTIKKRSIEEVDQTENACKKTKLNDNEFITSDRFKKIMEASSKHSDLLQQRDDEEKEKYFKKMEIKEKMEEKMINTHKVPCKAVRCLQCKYTSFSASDVCKNEKHPLKVFDATKRFFKCGDCGNRTVTLEIIPVTSCKNCGSGKWQKCGMMKDKSVVTHSLSIRGGEQKFVNSVVTDSNINLLVPESD